MCVLDVDTSAVDPENYSLEASSTALGHVRLEKTEAKIVKMKPSGFIGFCHFLFSPSQAPWELGAAWVFSESSDGQCGLALLGCALRHSVQMLLYRCDPYCSPRSSSSCVK